MRYLKQSTAAVVPFGPFVDKTDGVSLETGLVSALDHGTTGIMLSKNGGALTIRHATVTATTYDAHGNYLVTLDTTDTNTLGRLRVQYTDAATCLPVWQDYTVLAANAFDALAGSGVGLRADVQGINGSATLMANFAKNVEQMIQIVVDTTAVAATSTAFESSTVTDIDGAAVEATANHFVDRLLLWCTGPLQGKVCRINAYSTNGGRGVFTMTDKGEAPANGNIALLV